MSYPRWLTVLVLLLVSSNAFCWYKGPVTKQVMDSLIGNYALYWYQFQIRNSVWNEDSGKLVPPPDDCRGFMGDNTSTQPEWKWACHARMLAECGTDAQVAQTGLTRAQLFRRSSLEFALIKGNSLVTAGLRRWMSDSTQAMADTLIALAKEAYAKPSVPPSSSKWALRPLTRRDVIYAHDENMDYGSGGNFITGPFVAQDLADPRLISGRPVSEWIKEWYGAPNGASYKGVPYRNIHITPDYTPDFSSSHHGVGPYVDYAEWGAVKFKSMGEFGELTDAITKGQSVEENFVSPYSHAKDWCKWTLLITAGDGIVLEPIGMKRGLQRLSSGPLILSTIYKDPIGNPFFARCLEQGTAVPANVAYARFYDWNETLVYVWSYLLYRLVGPSDTALSYTDAAKRLHGSYWYRYHRYALHRTPDKFVTICWNGKPFGGNTNYMTATPAEKMSLASVKAGFAGLVTQIVPDNDALRPDNESKLTMNYPGNGQEDMASSCMQGAGPGQYTQYNLPVRNDYSDAVLSTTGRFLRTVNWRQGIGFRQYQSFISFYDKTCISYMQLFRGSYVQSGDPLPTNWTYGFGAAFHADTLVPEAKTLYSENGTQDLTRFSGSVGNSPWYCVNGRLGVGVKGGTGNFSVKRFVFASSDGFNKAIPGALIGWNQSGTNKWTSPEGTKIADYSAVYFTDTPPEQVKYLQSRMQPLDSLLPVGWKGLVSETPDSQRVMAVSRLRSDNLTAGFGLTYPEGGPVFEALTFIRNSLSKTVLSYDTLQTLGQTMAFYVKGETDTVVAEQIGDITVRLKGNGPAKLVYLSRAAANMVFVNNVSSSKTKQELKAGIDLTLSSQWTVVRIVNAVDEDHSGPASEVVWPQFFPDSACELWTDPGDYFPADSNSNRIPESPNTPVPESGLDVKIMAKDRSGVALIKVYLDYDSVGVIVPTDPYDMKSLYTFHVPRNKLGADSSFHAVHVIAYDVLGNSKESFTVPFRVSITGSTGIEHSKSPLAIKESMISKSKAAGSINNVGTRMKLISEQASGVDSWVAHCRVKPDVNSVNFRYNGTDYMLVLSAKTGSVSLFRKDADCKMLLGQAVLKVSSGKWYDLKVRASDNGLTGFVNGEEKLAVTGL